MYAKIRVSQNKTSLLSGIKKWWLPRRLFFVLRVDGHDQVGGAFESCNQRDEEKSLMER